ncbi:FAD-binding oxidoreductase [Roseisolibacter sp. H3M3-2]|uniref:FAD-binding oxidoreductase n=1 Tax=Roseisolibacter sp. H3M3-2 TaxID=3031323 RepID=UPI0023DCA8F5|nr:FAD-binding oxidoreductase [Roseisolibacter sp. H3M3-2]MDF1501566.1 FAD-binding oxidoreductase [Roseisolibacter sp. H3M3-2]
MSPPVTAPALVTDPAIREGFAQDASGLRLVPEAVARPDSADAVVALLREAHAAGTPVTAAGAQTSYVGGSIADRGIVLSLRTMDRVLDLDPAARTMRVQPGALLGDVKRAAAAHGLLFAPDPTSEEESTLGGSIACNSSGARSLKYGATRPHVLGLTVALADGRVLELRRPAMEKNVAGYAPVHDLLDWFVGSEGTLGVVLEAELRLLPLPTAVTGLGLPFPTAASALGFIAAARAARDAGVAGVNPRCLEYLDEQAFAIARDFVGGTWGQDARAYVYTEEESFGDAEPPLDAWLALAEAHDVLADDIQVFEGEANLHQARRMRHAVPATLNERAARFRAQGGRKVSTDWAVPYPRLREALEAANAIAATFGVAPVGTFGHAGNGHPHQHFLAHDPHELETIERAVDATLRHVLSMGGTVAAEHGIGKLKRRWLPLQLSPEQFALMQATKLALDPKGILAPGNVFAP